MKLLKIILTSIAMILLFALSLEASENLYSPRVPDHYIVVLNENLEKSVPETANEMARIHGLGLGHIYSHTIKGFSAYIPEKKLELLKSDPRVNLIDPDFIVHAFDMPELAKVKPGTITPPPPPPQQIPTGINRIDAELNATTKEDGVGVAVLDTGIDVDHPDILVAGGYTAIKTRTGYDDDNGHGTHVAGIIAAKDNDEGVIGVAPGAKLYAVKVLDKTGSGSWSGVIAGIEWVTANANIIKVANMSLGGSGTEETSSSLRTAIETSVSKGITYVVAAGNEAKDAMYSVPAAYDSVITVSAIVDTDGEPGRLGPATLSYGADDSFASFSNFGEDVDIAAPGVNILSTWKGGGYKIISGTSMATPHVAGAAALYIFNNQGLAPSEVKAALVSAGEIGGFTGDPDTFKEPLVHASDL